MEIISLSKGSYYILLNQIYILEKIVGKNCYFRCYEKNCPGRVKELNSYITITKEHGCKAENGKIESMRLLKKFEMRCADDQFSCDSIIQELFYKASDEAKLYLPTKTALVQRYKRIKGKNNINSEKGHFTSFLEDYNNSNLSNECETGDCNFDIIKKEEEYPSKEDKEFLKSITDALSGVKDSLSSINNISPIFQLKSTECQIDEVNDRIRSLRRQLSEAIKLKRQLIESQ